MTDKEPFEHDDVVSSLLDLQRRLRGSEAGAGETPPDDLPAGTSVRTIEEPGSQEPGTQDPGTQEPKTQEPGSPAPRSPQGVEVSETDLSVLMTPAPEREPGEPDPVAAGARFAPVTQLPTTAAGDVRVSVLAQRLSRLEQDLSGVLESIGTMQDDVTAVVTAEVAGRMTSMQEEADARAARLVAERMDAVSNRLTGELGAQRRNLAGLLEQRIAEMEATLDETIRDAASVDGDDARPQG